MASQFYHFLAFYSLVIVLAQVGLALPVDTRVDANTFEPLPPISFGYSTRPLLPFHCRAFDVCKPDSPHNYNYKLRGQTTLLSLTSDFPSTPAKPHTIQGWQCSNGPRPDYFTGHAHGNQVTHMMSQALAAANVGDALIRSGQHHLSGSSYYPHPFRNRERLHNIVQYQWCGWSRTLWEFPIFPDRMYRGGDPGPDRVVWDSCTRKLYAVITHRGKWANGFRDCVEYGG